MKEGTVKLTSQQLAEAAARMGSTLDIDAGADQTNAGPRCACRSSRPTP